MKSRLYLALGLISFPGWGLCQSSSDVNAPTVVVAPDISHSLYHLIRVSARHDLEQSQTLIVEGISSTIARPAFSKVLSATVGISETQASSFILVAKQAEAEFANLDQQATVLIENARALVAKGSLLPPSPPELKSLQVRKDILIGGREGKLKNQLTSDSLDKLTTFAITSSKNASRQSTVMTQPVQK